MTFAAVFPGQGAQSVGMLSDLADSFACVKQTFDQATEVLGFDLWKLVQEGPESDLNMTSNTQPALLAASVSVWRAWLEKSGALPAFMAGHSLGEYSALVCAGAIDFQVAIDLVRRRGQYMQEAVPVGEGAMAAIIGLDDDTISKICAEAAQGDVVSPANLNSPGQVVVSGATAAVGRAEELANEAGAKKTVRLQVSAPFHCGLMRPAAENLKPYIEKAAFLAPEIPVVNNVDVVMNSDPDAIKDALIRQIDSPVRWVEIVQSLAKENITHQVEMGPGKVLTGLVKRIAPDVKGVNVADVETLDAALSEVS